MASIQLSTTRRRRATWVPYLPYLIPGVIAFVVVIGYPLAMNIYYSLFKWKGGLAPMRWYGLGNYADLLADEAFWTSFRNSISMVVAMVVVPALIGLVLAAVLAVHDLLNQRARHATIARRPRVSATPPASNTWAAVSEMAVWAPFDTAARTQSCARLFASRGRSRGPLSGRQRRA